MESATGRTTVTNSVNKSSSASTRSGMTGRSVTVIGAVGRQGQCTCVDSRMPYVAVIGNSNVHGVAVN